MAAVTGFFITFEGVEGAGKSTQCRLLAAALRRAGRTVVETREPGGTPVGEELRRIVKHAPAADGVCRETELLLMAASRAQLLQQVIRPALAAGAVVLCDRFADSTTVYQGVARGLDLAFIDALHRFTVGPTWPQLTFLLDLPAADGLARAGGRGGSDRFEREALAFHQRVRDGFLRRAEQCPDRFRVLDARLAPEAMHQRVHAEVAHALG